MTVQKEITLLRKLQSDHSRFFSQEEFDKLNTLVRLTQSKKGDKVHYIPFDVCDKESYENGMVKENCDDEENLWVVYHCGEEWDNFENYTAANTSIRQLEIGWK